MRSWLTWIFSVNFYWWVQLCMQRPAKSMPFQQIIMHALQCQHDIDVHLLFCFDIDLHLTCSQLRFSLMGTTLCATPNNLCAILTYYHVLLQCPHDIHVHLFCFDLHKFLLRSRAATCPTSNCGRGTSLFRQELVYICFKAPWKFWNRFHSKAILKQHVKYGNNLMKICYLLLFNFWGVLGNRMLNPEVLMCHENLITLET